jgi:hypothetical protein
MKTHSTIARSRIRKRNLPDLLVHKFLTEYGYAHGPVIARAIVDDILTTVEQCYSEHVPPKTVVWLAVRRESRGQRKGLDISNLIPVQLEVITDDEIEILTDSSLGNAHRHKARYTFNRVRFVRWCQEAYDQGGVLTHLDLSLLSGLSTGTIGRALRQHEAETGQVVPTRGTVHDMGPSVTHKAEVIRRWLRHESPAQIARVLNHSQASVDRYIADYQKVRLLAQRFPEANLPAASGLSARVVLQYVALLREYEPTLALYQETEILQEGFAVPSSSQTEPDAQPTSRVPEGEAQRSLDVGEHLAIVRQTMEQPSVGH